MKLRKYQEDAIKQLQASKFRVVDIPTQLGKTLICDANRGVLTCLETMSLHEVPRTENGVDK